MIAGTLALLAGCASTTGNLQRETARSIGGNIADNQVVVTDVVRGMTSVKWKAATSGGTYDCSADDMVRRVHCVRASEPALNTKSSSVPKAATESPISAHSVQPFNSALPIAATIPLSLKDAQVILNRLGFKAGTPDGVAGRLTTEALRQFQKTNGLAQTGRLDAATEQALGRQ